MGLERKKVTGFAIDGPHSKDLDDAILLSSDKEGFTITVSISDVSGTVQKGSDIDSRALERAFTRYFARGNNPMLPRRLSEDALSLIPNSPRDVIIFEIRLNSELETTGVKVELGRFKSKRRYTHKEVDDILEDKQHKEHGLWMMYYKFAEKLLNNRRKTGALVVYDLMTGFYTNEEGVVMRKKPGEYFRPYVIVQEFMILVNYAATVHLSQKGVPLLYRNHATLVSDANQEELLRQLYGSTETLTAEVLADLSIRVRNLVGRARYEAACKGHFGLNLPMYTHWTSPIRRYADLVNHRQLVASISGSPFAYTAKELQVIGDHINAVNDEIKDATSSSHKAETQKGLRDASKDELLKLEIGHFSYFVRMLTREEIPLTEQRFEVIAQKMQERTLPLVDYVRILFTEVPDEVLWRQLQQNALQALVVNPDDVRMTLGLARQTLEWESVVQHTQVGDGRFSATVSVTRGSLSFQSQSFEGGGKAEAETLAIVDLLRTMTKIDIQLPKGTKMTTSVKGNHKGILMELCSQKRWSYPIYSSSQQGPSHQPLFSCVAELSRTDQDILRTDACKATTKKEAEQLASQALLTLLGVDKAGNGASAAQPPGPAPGTDWQLNPISALQEFCQKQGAALPSYDDEQNGKDHSPTFKVRCQVSIGGIEQTFEGKGNNKKEAKKNAASKACEHFFASTA